MCTNCQSDNRKLWGPGSSSPTLEIVHTGNWISLEICNKCSTYWVHSFYEPYASFPYWVKWSFSPASWANIHNLDDGRMMCDWHILEIQKNWTRLSPAERESIQAHRKRTYGVHNPVDMPIENAAEIRRIIATHTNLPDPS